MSDLNGNKCMHASEQQIVIKSEQQNHLVVFLYFSPGMFFTLKTLSEQRKKVHIKSC